ncbi:MAG: hypothetical protein HUJ84_03055 [Veillonella sp.]|nr:hypothetical protein [Veillonella sp.]MCF0156178.1 hypothetical protein [Veillonella sp.]
MMHIIKKNKMAKFLTLIAAILLWFFVVREQNPMVEVTYNVAIQQQNLDSHYVVEGVPAMVRVTLRGPRDTMVTLRPEFMKASLDLDEVKPGQNNVTITFTPPNGVTVVDLKPDNITVVVDEYAERQLPVEISPTGWFSSDVALKSLSIIPQTVKVSGPKEMVNRVAHVQLNVNLANQTKNFTATGKLIAVDAAGKPVDVSITPDQAQAQYELERIRTEKAVSVNADTIGQVADGYVVKNITLTPAQISVAGKEDVLKNLTALKTEPIDLTGATANVEGTYNVILPDGITSDIHMVTVRVEVAKQ